MAADASQVLAHEDGPFSVPHTYTLGPGESFQPSSICVLWDGGGAAGEFLPCCSFYSSDGKLLGRAFPGSIPAGDSVRVTYSPFALSVAAAAGLHFSPPENIAPAAAPHFQLKAAQVLFRSTGTDGELELGPNAIAGNPGIRIGTGADPIDLSTGAGKLDLSTGTGDLDLSTGTGDLRLAPGGELRLEALTRLTVGAAGPAAALPATPDSYLEVVDNGGNLLSIPLFAR